LVAELAFFVGKGGVGKTTVSAAFAIRRAAEKSSRRMLLVSTDPAHSLGDVLQKKLLDSPQNISVAGQRKLTAWEISFAKLFRSFLDEHKRQLVETIEHGSLFTAAEISSLLETTLPGMSEIAGLLAIQEAIASGRYSDIVVDTAPFGHTLRLFGLPKQFLRLLNFLELSADRDRVLAQHFGGRVQVARAAFVGEWRTKIAELRKAFATARLFLVTTPERFALNESVRCLRELRESSSNLHVEAIVLNRVVLEARGCANCRARAKSVRAARIRLRKEFSSAELYVAEDPGGAILGIDRLRKFGSHVFDGKPLKWTPASRRVPKKS
jgi:arsenite/tail-anchored protein-transporting ATPase